MSPGAPSLSQQSSQKKQIPISSFFSATPAPVQAPKSPECDRLSAFAQYGLQSDRSESTEHVPTTDDLETIEVEVQASRDSKRALRKDGHEDLPDPKRLKGPLGGTVDNGWSAQQHSQPKRQSLAQLSTNSVEGTNKQRVTERTSKYVFSSSPASASAEDPREEDDEQTRKMKARLHERFVKRLGKPDSMTNIRRRNHALDDEDQAGEHEEGDEDAEDETEAQPKPIVRGRKGAMVNKGKTKLTPMEKQVIDIKRNHQDTLLIVEVGYKFRFFGEDARIAAKELSIVCIPGKYRFDEHPSEAHLDRFASASVPVHRLHVHVKRLVSAGHKVGVVRQLETAALKAAGNNRNTTFERGLTNLYTKGTYIDDQEGLEAPTAAPDGGVPATGHLLCLTETFPKGWGTDERVQIGLVAVQPATGDIIYDDFDDGWMRSELETRLLHIAPCEFLVVGEVTRATEKLIQHLSGSKTNVFGDKARVERVNKPKTMAAESHSHITKFYADKMKLQNSSSSLVESSQEKGTLLDKVHRLSESTTICLSAMIQHLKEYKLEHVFDLTKNFQSFNARSHMLINGNTLNSLEIYRNQTDNTGHGSLFWTLDRTQTRSGQRLLRKWIGRPLLDRTRLDERVAAVEELKNGQQSSGVDRLKRLLGKIRGDLERSLIRIYYSKCTRPELLSVLQTLQMIAQEFGHVCSVADSGFDSPLLGDAVASLPKIADDVIRYLEQINSQAAKDDDKYNFLRGEHETEDIADHKVGIVAVEHDLDNFRTIAAEKLKRKRVDYVTVAGIDFLIELDNSSLKHVPASWAKISGTKKVSRYHAPEVVRLIRERDQHKEALANACDAAFKALLSEIGSKYQHFRDCVQALAQLDCLLSLADVASQPGYCKPEFLIEPGIFIEAGRHPMVEQLLLDAFVPNDVRLDNSTCGLLITGPNMGGKSSYVRSVALIAIMAQIGSYVPASSMRLGLLDAVFTRMGAFDNMMKGESTFMVELSETSDILKQATPRSLVILDELGRGTSTHDGVAIAQAVLHHMMSQLKSFTLFITHYTSLARVAEQFEGTLKNVHMRFSEKDSGEDGDKDITFLYEVAEGVAHRSYGLNVAKLAGLPRTLIEEAGRRSRDMEEGEVKTRMGHLAKAVANAVEHGGLDKMEHLVAGIEHL